jgi:hypothetical protein
MTAEAKPIFTAVRLWRHFKDLAQRFWQRAAALNAMSVLAESARTGWNLAKALLMRNQRASFSRRNSRL